MGIATLGAALGVAAACKKDDGSTSAAQGDGPKSTTTTTGVGAGGSGGSTNTTTGTTGTTSTGSGGAGGALGGGGGGGGSGGGLGDPCGGCPAGMVCDPGLGCVDCYAAGDCKEPGKSVCVLGACAACASSFDCDQPQVCSQVDHTCTAPCGADSDCKGGGAALCDPVGHFCAECTAEVPCPAEDGGAPSSCFFGRCVACFSQAQCSGAKPLCDVNLGECVECLANSQCKPGKVCKNGTCTAK